MTPRNGEEVMPDIDALTKYINERRARENDGAGFTFVRDLPPNLQDTFFALSCLKMLNAESPDDSIIRFISGYDRFSFYGAYFVMKCLKLADVRVCFEEGLLKWSYKGDTQERPCSIPSTPLISYFNYEVYGEYGSSIFSSPLYAAFKRIELGAAEINQGAINSVMTLLSKGSYPDLMVVYAALEIQLGIKSRGIIVDLSPQVIKRLRLFLRLCTTRRGYVASPTAAALSLESTYAGHKVAQHLGLPDPLGVQPFVDSLQNENGGFRRTEFGGISTLESCYMATSITVDNDSLD